MLYYVTTAEVDALTIAALSSGIPTLSFTYSIKAKGINRDLFGHDHHVHEFKNSGTETPVNKIVSMLDDVDRISKHLKEEIPGVKKTALKAGSCLKDLLEGA